MPKGDIYSRYSGGSSKSTYRLRSASRGSGRGSIYSKYAKGQASHKSSGSGGPSVFNRIMDVLSRGNYAVAGAVKGGMGPDYQKKGAAQLNPDVLKGFWGGLSGKKKGTFQELVPHLGLTRGTNNKIAMGAEGFAYDVLTDPTNALGVGIAKAPLKVKQGVAGVDKAADAGRAIENVTDATSAATKAADAARVADEAKKATEALRTARRAARKTRQSGKTSTKLMEALAEADRVKDVARTAQAGTKVGPEQLKAQKLIDELLGAKSAPVAAAPRLSDDILGAAAKVDDAVPPPVGKLWSRALEGKAVGGKVGAAGKVSAAAEDAFQPSMFDDALDVGRAEVPRPTMAPEPVPGPAKAVVDDTPGLAGLTDAGAPLKRALELRVLGKGVLRSEKAYDALAVPLRTAGATKGGQALSRTFRTAHGLLPEVHNLQRIHSGQGRQVVADKTDEIHKIFSGGDEAAGVAYPRVKKDGQKQIFAAIQEGAKAVDLLPPELKIPAQYMQIELAKLQDLSKRTDDNLLDLDVAVDAKAARDAKFEEIPKYKGAKKADGTPDILDRAPQAFIAQYDRAVRKQYFDKFSTEVAKRFPDKSDEMMGNMKKAREVFGVDGEVSVAWRHHIDMVQGHWKRWVTQYRPGFHIRNMLGDSFNAYLAGTNPSRFKDAGRVLAHNWGKKADAGGNIKMGHRTFSAQETEGLYRRGGLETSFIETEVIGASRRRLGHAITEGSQQREKYVRMATFIDSMDKGLKRGVSVEKAVEEAAFRVRKYHFDYTDLTPAERKLRTFIPFYTYSRKQLPLLLEHTLTSPGKIINTQKVGGALETMLGVDQSDPDDPFPGIEGLMPEYMKDQQFIQRGNNKVFTPGLPTDLLGMMGPRSFVKTQAGNLGPVFKGPLELATGKSFPLGYSLKKKGQSEEEMIARYMAAYLPYGNFARDSKSPLSERLLNMLTGVGSKTVRG